MAVDLQINLQTGDLAWNGNRDLAIAEGTGVIDQRIHNRLLIPRGSFIYDQTGTLGSMLQNLLNLGVPNAANQISQIVQDALEPMTDINVLDVQVFTLNDGSGISMLPSQATVQIKYQIVVASAATTPPNTAPVTTQTFVIPT